MKRKSLYALALLLALSTVAFSNERARFRCRTAGTLKKHPTPTKTTYFCTLLSSCYISKNKRITKNSSNYDQNY